MGKNFFRYYSFLISSIIIGICFSLYEIKHQILGLDNDYIILINVLLLISNILFFSARKSKTCPKCNQWKNNKVISRLEEMDIIMPHPYNILERYECNKCGHVWDVYSEERLGD